MSDYTITKNDRVVTYNVTKFNEVSGIFEERYQVMAWDEGQANPRLTCTCKAWLRPGRTSCRHTEMVQQYMAAGEPENFSVSKA